MLSRFETEMTMQEQNELAQHESVIERGFKTFVEVGTALMSIRDKRLYRTTHSSFEDYCRDRWNMSRTNADELIRAANIVENLTGTPVTSLPQSVNQVRPLRSLSDDDQRAAWQEAVDTAPDGKITGAHVASVVERYKQPEPDYKDTDEVKLTDLVNVIAYCPTCDVRHKGWILASLGRIETYRCSRCDSEFSTDEWEDTCDPLSEQIQAPIVTPNRAYKNSSESNEWYTPRPIIDKARAVLGEINLDPASNIEANQTIQADNIYTIDDNALTLPWFGNVWLNPPYGSDVEPFIDKLLAGVRSGDVSDALLLVAARTDTAWFRKLREYPRCFIWGRIKFISGETLEPGDPAGFPSMVVYMGTDEDKFIREFQTIGDIYIWTGTLE